MYSKLGSQVTRKSTPADSFCGTETTVSGKKAGAASPDAQAGATSPNGQTGLSSGRVLIVDDSETACKQIRIFLESDAMYRGRHGFKRQRRAQSSG